MPVSPVISTVLLVCGDELGALDHFLHRAAAADDAVVVELGVALADQVLPLGLQAQALDGAAGQREQFVDLERLLEEVLDAELERLAHDLGGSVRRHHDYLRAFGFRASTADSSRISSRPVMPGIRLSTTKQVEGALAELALCFARGRRFDHLVPLVAQARDPDA